MLEAQNNPPILPLYVDDVMADLAVVFHWTPADMNHMTVDELMEWRERARVRSQVDKDK
jgi:Phage P2 GpE.